MSDCSCIYVDCEPIECLSENIRKARKTHICCECKKEIIKGEKYEDYAGVFDGEFYAYKTCLDCVSIREEFFCNGWHYKFLYDNLEEHIYEVGGEISSSCIIPLTKRAKDMVCDLIEKYWEEWEVDDEEE